MISLARLAWTRPLALAAWCGAAVYLAAHLFQVVDEIKMNRVARRVRARCPEPTDDELARFVLGELDEEKAEAVRERAAVSSVVADRIHMMGQAERARWLLSPPGRFTC